MVDIALKGVATTALAAGGLYVALQKNSFERGEKCSAMVAKLYDSPPNMGNLESRQFKMNRLIEIYGQTCEIMPDKEVQFLMASITAPASSPNLFDASVAATQTTDSETGLTPSLPSLDPLPHPKGKPAPPSWLTNTLATGWVAIGRIGGTYGQINFDDAEALLVRPLPRKSGLVLKARWPVNLRENNENTQLGGNPVLRVLDVGECVQIDSTQEIRGQVWAKVQVTECPAS